MSAGTANAIHPILIGDFNLHSFDAEIKESLGFDSAVILYFSEKASITTDEKAVRNSFEPMCYPFYLMKDGMVKEAGYDCRTFFCVGYFAGNPLCKDNDGKIYYGTDAINKRSDYKRRNILFSSFPLEKQTDYMKKRMNTIGKNGPYYIAEFQDVITGEGYTTGNGTTCELHGPNFRFSYPTGLVGGSRFDNDDGGGFMCNSPMPANWQSGLSGDTKIEVPETDPVVLAKQHLEEARKVYSEAASRSAEAANQNDRNFSDVSNDHYAYKEISSLFSKGVIKGYDDGTFKPEKTVNRAELLKLLIVGLQPTEDKSEKQCFPDVSDEWFSSFVCAAKRLGWVGGYASGQFKPANTVNRAEAIKMIVSSVTTDLDSSASLPNDVPTDSWFAPYVRKAVELGIVIETSFKPTEVLTRADAAIWIYRGTAK